MSPAVVFCVQVLYYVDTLLTCFLPTSRQSAMISCHPHHQHHRQKEACVLRGKIKKLSEETFKMISPGIHNQKTQKVRGLKSSVGLRAVLSVSS